MVMYAEFSPDGRRIVTANTGGAAQIWDASTGRPLSPRMQLIGATYGCARFSPDGSLLATTDGTSARLWDAATGALIVTLPAPGCTYLAFSRDGHRLMASPFDTFTLPVRVWDLPLDQRPINDTMRLAEVLACQRMDPRIGPVPMEMSQQRDAWQHLRTASPTDFQAEKTQLLAWQEQQANAALEASDWTAARRYLEPQMAAMRKGQRASDIYIWFQYALVQLALGDTEGYRKTCSDALARFGADQDAFTANQVAWICALGPVTVSDAARAVKIAERAVASAPKEPDILKTLGVLLYRTGRYEEAIRRLNESIAARDGVGIYVDWFFLALAHHRLGHVVEARRWLDKAVQWIEQNDRPKTEGATPLPWYRRLLLQLFRREAEVALQSG
jgi:tetratricopeptide (TPR) repeat protein